VQSSTETVANGLPTATPAKNEDPKCHGGAVDVLQCRQMILSIYCALGSVKGGGGGIGGGGLQCFGAKIS
jgi:hypothetical protein